jgi:hypothetical protein
MKRGRGADYENRIVTGRHRRVVLERPGVNSYQRSERFPCEHPKAPITLQLLLYRLQLVLHSFHPGFGDRVFFAVVWRLIVGLICSKVGILHHAGWVGGDQRSDFFTYPRVLPDDVPAFPLDRTRG